MQFSEERNIGFITRNDSSERVSRTVVSPSLIADQFSNFPDVVPVLPWRWKKESHRRSVSRDLDYIGEQKFTARTLTRSNGIRRIEEARLFPFPTISSPAGKELSKDGGTVVEEG